MTTFPNDALHPVNHSLGCECWESNNEKQLRVYGLEISHNKTAGTVSAEMFGDVAHIPLECLRWLVAE